MTTPANVDRSPTDRAAVYRAAERDFLASYGLEASERFVEAGPSRARLRVQEIGSGEPILFVHGTGGSGAYFAPLVRALEGFRCLLLDRPGWGLSEPVDFSDRPYTTVVTELLHDTLKAFGVERAHVVGASVGNVWALRLAQAHPARVRRLVLLGGMPSPELDRIPVFIRLLRSPLGRVIVRLPQNPKIMRKQLAGLGHEATLEAGSAFDAFIEWRVIAAQETDFLRHERDMVRAVLDRRGFRPGIAPEPEELRQIEHPTLMVYGTADPVGSTDLWERFVERLPAGELVLVEDAGHLPWYDAASRISQRMRRFLAR